ncbi:MAG: hypothetical protein K6G29_05520 [Clostridiales bacterium]|nr:hypothetical protein [Clostridiales bacterium]
MPNPLLPPILPDDEVSLIPAEPGGRPMTPDWVRSLVLTEVHLETATPEGTFDAAVRVLDHLADLGVNGIWLTPIYEKGPRGNGYSNFGPHTVEPALCPDTEPEERLDAVRRFVAAAHERRIRVLLDIVTWGTATDAPLFREHPEWYRGRAWGNEAFDWSHPAFRAWFTSVAVNNLLFTGADGYRCDCEPYYAGYEVWEEVRRRCLSAGRKVLIMAEDGAERRYAFDMEQDGVLWYAVRDRGGQYADPVNYYLEKLDIVDSVKSGEGIGSPACQGRGEGGRYRFYTCCVSNHDYQRSAVNLNRLALGYQAIFAPFIPLWYLGAEFGMQTENQVLYFVPVDWSLTAREENAAFLADIRRYLTIRRSYPEIFEFFPPDHRDANIRKVRCCPEFGLTAYERYAPDGSRSVLVLPNPADGVYTAEVFPENIEGDFRVTDLLTGQEVPVQGSAFRVEIGSGRLGVYLAEKCPSQNIE